MMRWIVGASLRSRGLVVALGVGVLLLGVTQLRELPRDVLPEFTPPTVEVQTEALGLSAEEVEQLITVPLEQDLLDGVAFLDVIRSESVPGLSRIEMIFEPGTEIARARQVVNERLTQAHALPNVSKPPQMLQPVSSTSRVMMIGLSSQARSLINMSVLSQWTIRPRLMAIPGVANVSIWGQRDQQLQVQVDPKRLHASGVTLDRIIRTAGNALWVSPLTFLEASTPGTGGFFDTPTQRLGVQHTQPIETPEDLAKVVIEDSPDAPASSAGAKQRLSDVATVVQDHQPLIGDAVFTDGPGLLFVIEKFPEANTLEVTRDIEDALADLKPGMSGIAVDSSFFKPARYIEQSTDNVRNALLIGLVLLVLALGAFLLHLRTVVVRLVAILVSLAAAVIVLSVRGETMNAMVLAGLVLALAVIIDDSIGGVDSLRRGLDRGGEEATHESTARRVGVAVLADRGALLFGTFILLLALLPIFVLRGETGAFLPSLARSYAGAVVASMLVALTVTPALEILLLGNAPSPRRISPPVRWIQARYNGHFSRFVSARSVAFTLAVLLVLGLASVLFIERGSSMVPEFKDRDLLIQWSGAPGTSLPEMQRITARAASELRALPGVANIGGHAGRALLGDQTVGVNSSELWVSLDASADYQQTVDSIEEVVNGYPGVENSMLTYPKERINDILKTPDGVEGKDLTVRVFGHDLDTLKTQADEVKKALAGIDGVEAPRVELPVEEPTLEVDVDLEKAQELGIKPGDVRRAAATVLSGIEVGNLFEQQKIFPVVVWGTPETRNSVNDVRRLLIDRPGGAGQVRLDDIADVRVIASPNVFRHEDISRNIDVGVDVNGRDLDAVASDIKDRIRSLDFPLEYHAALLGDYEDRQAARLRFIAISIAAALGIFLLLQAAFGSWRMAAVTFLALPLALSGGLVAALIDGDPVSIGSLMGLLALFGLAARHAVLFVKRCHELEDEAGGAFDPELARRVAQERLTPIVISAATTGLALLPLLFFGGLAGHEIVHPMTAVVLGGLVTTTVLNLLVVPALYLRFGPRSEAGRERFEGFVDLAGSERTRDSAEPVVAPITIDA